MRWRSAPRRLEWLDLLEISGPFLSPPVIERVFPQGLDVLDTDHAAKVRLARDDWADSQHGSDADPIVQSEWIRLVLTQTLEFTPEILLGPDAIPVTLALDVPEYDMVIRPDFVLAEPPVDGQKRRERLLIQVYPRHQDLDGAVRGSTWATAPSTRMTQLCRANGVRLGLVTNGERWMLVDAPVGETSAYASWYASLWSQEPDTLRAFRSLLHTRRFFGVAQSETLEGMLSESASYQAEVTEQLGAQVRRAIEVLVQAVDRADADTGRRLLADIRESELYEAAITVMMRLVFLFFAEESGLLLLGDETYDQFYSASMLRGQLREEADNVGLEVLERRQDAWCRLLATFRGIYAGVAHDALHLPAYGGSLFDPDRFPFLEGRKPDTTWVDAAATPLPIDNRTVLHLLDALQVLQTGGGGGEARKLSFRALDIEQIGHVYESLLDHVAVRASTPTVGLVGPRGAEPEVSLDDLDVLRDRGDAALLEFLVATTKRSRPTVSRAIGRKPDPDAVERLRIACGGDELLARVLPYHALIRDDPWGDAVVVQAGSIFVTAGPERRGTGTYYTPRALTEEVVTNAIEPLVYRGPADGKPRDEWELKAPAELLDLKICDFAMGSGAFLVQACRWLADRLLESWERVGADDGPVTPLGTPATGALSETVVPAIAEERRALARRLVADRCLYGVDINPLAVEMAKLSMWLITLAKDRPFSFLDHALKCGDSLLGVHRLDQIRHFHVDPHRGRELHTTLFDATRQIEPSIAEAVRLRDELESFPVIDVGDTRHKASLHRAADAAVESLRILGDVLIGARIATIDSGDATFEAMLSRFADEIPVLLGGSAPPTREKLELAARRMLDAGKPGAMAHRRPFHWPIEFPEVFARETPGFDALVGNPPFMGAPKITGAYGEDYREYMVGDIANHVRGLADLVTYFLLRATKLAVGTTGLIATKTVTEGDSRVVGLDQVVQERVIYRAVKSRPWPGQQSVFVSEVWTAPHWDGSCVLEDQVVSGITSALEVPSRVEGQPYRLAEMAHRSFEGFKSDGIGFILSVPEAEELLSREPASADVVLPWLTGEDLNQRPTADPSRYAIFFSDRSLEQTRECYPLALEIVRERVKPYRDGVKRKANRERWWQFAETRPGLRKAITGLNRYMVITHHSKTIAPLVIPGGWLPSHALVVFALSDDFDLGLLTSSLHWWWALTYGSKLKNDPRYTSTTCFETYPRPTPDHAVALAAAGLSRHRAIVMRDLSIGLTSTYNRFHDPGEKGVAISELRHLHVDLDSAVAAAYEWSDIALEHDFYDTPQGVRYTLGPTVRIEILDRLLELNHHRHKAEVGQGLLSLTEPQELADG